MAQQQVRATGALYNVDPVWTQIRREAEEIARREPELATFIYSTVLHHDTLEAAVVHRVAAGSLRVRRSRVGRDRPATPVPRPRSRAVSSRSCPRRSDQSPGREAT